jgi:hypothetical protein
VSGGNQARCPLSGPASPIAEVRGIADRQSNLAGVPGRQFENGSCRTRSSEDAPGPAALDDFHDLVGAVEEYDIDGALHEPCVDGPAAGNEEEEIGVRPFAEKTDDLTSD